MQYHNELLFQVSDLLTVLHFLESQNPNDKETWRSRFVLILWLSIIVIIPFHMSRLDGFTPQEQGIKTFIIISINFMKEFYLTHILINIFNGDKAILFNIYCD